MTLLEIETSKPITQTHKMKTLKTYHFDFGNSSNGTIGGSASVLAYSKKEALKMLKRQFPSDNTINAMQTNPTPKDVPGVQYFNIYLNPEMITVSDIDFTA